MRFPLGLKFWLNTGCCFFPSIFLLVFIVCFPPFLTHVLCKHYQERILASFCSTTFFPCLSFKISPFFQKCPMPISSPLSASTLSPSPQYSGCHLIPRVGNFGCGHTPLRSTQVCYRRGHFFWGGGKATCFLWEFHTSFQEFF